MESTINPRVDLVRREAELGDLVGASIAESLRLTMGLWRTFQQDATCLEEHVPLHEVVRAVSRSLLALTEDRHGYPSFPQRMDRALSAKSDTIEKIALSAAAEAMAWRQPE
jgi:hypothetical protein